MSSLLSIFSELRSVQVASLLILAFIAVVFGTGIYVVSGRWGAGRPKRDATAIARWNEARQEGFWPIAVRRHLLGSAFASYLLAAHYGATSLFSFSLASLSRAVLLAPALWLFAAGMDWFSLRRRAEEAHDRAARLQDEQNDDRLRSRFRCQ